MYQGREIYMFDSTEGKSLWCITTTSWYEVWTSHSFIHKGSPHIDIADSNNSPSSHNSKYIYVSSQS